MASLISLRSLAPSLPFLFFLFSFAEDGRSLYLKYCAQCHHESRIGKTAPPLLRETLKRRSREDLIRIVKEGIPSSRMPAFGFLPEEDIKRVVDYIRSPAGDVSFTLGDIKKSRIEVNAGPKELNFKDMRNLTVVVDKGKREVWLMEGERVLDKFHLPNVHGGVKFSREGFYVPARDGWIAHYSFKEGRLREKVRACVYLRNVALSPSGGRLVASCVLPPSIVLMDERLNPIKVIRLKGRPSAVYELVRRGGFILTFRDVPYVAFMDEKGKVSYRRIDVPLEDFFIDPFEEFLIGSSRKEKKVVVYDLETLRRVFEKEVPGLPHLFSAGFWYSEGKFYFATRHIGSTKVSVWRMYDWALVKEIDTGGTGFFVRTSPKIPSLWIDNGNGSYLLLDKRTLSLSRLEVTDGGRATHVEFSADGKIAYVSVVGKESGLYLYDPLSLRLIKRIPAGHPAGKYNFVLKSRRFYPALLGEEVFMAKCWGCHHQTREAFGPSFRWIANHRSREEIVSQMLSPEETSKLLGYKRNAMPKINLSREEIEALLSLMEELRDERRLVADHR